MSDIRKHTLLAIMNRNKLKAAPAHAVSVKKPVVLVTSLYNGNILKILGTYCVKTTITNCFFITRDMARFALGALI